MKKLKFMLLSFALLAVVGGALAFKAKFNERYCYTFTNEIHAATPALWCSDDAGLLRTTCPEFDPEYKTDPAIGELYCYTTDQFGNECKDQAGINTLPCRQVPELLTTD